MRNRVCDQSGFYGGEIRSGSHAVPADYWLFPLPVE